MSGKIVPFRRNDAIAADLPLSLQREMRAEMARWSPQERAERQAAARRMLPEIEAVLRDLRSRPPDELEPEHAQ